METTLNGHAEVLVSLNTADFVSVSYFRLPLFYRHGIWVRLANSLLNIIFLPLAPKCCPAHAGVIRGFF